LGDASFVGPGSTRRLLRRLLTKPLVPRVLAHSGDDPYRIAKLRRGEECPMQLCWGTSEAGPLTPWLGRRCLLHHPAYK